jgi:hypothetical protein
MPPPRGKGDIVPPHSSQTRMVQAATRRCVLARVRAQVQCKPVAVQQVSWRLDGGSSNLGAIVTTGFAPGTLPLIVGPNAADDAGDDQPDESADVDYTDPAESQQLVSSRHSSDRWLEEELASIMEADQLQDWKQAEAELRAEVGDAEESEGEVDAPLPPHVGATLSSGSLQRPVASDSLAFRRAAALAIDEIDIEAVSLFMQVHITPSWCIEDTANGGKKLGKIRTINGHLFAIDCDHQSTGGATALVAS